jgi:transposase InsO family protein
MMVYTVGKLQKYPRGSHTVLLITVDKFTKWIEAVPITSADATSTVNLFRSITRRFGVPHNIFTDNGSNFTAGEFQDFCIELGIQISYASVAHPQANRQVEKGNNVVCSRLKNGSCDPSSEKLGHGSRNYPRFCGAYEQPPIGPHSTCRS